MFYNARLTRDWPMEEEKRAEAERQVRMAMYRSALGQISHEERDCILAILRPCCPEIFSVEPPPAVRPDGFIH